MILEVRKTKKFNAIMQETLPADPDRVYMWGVVDCLLKAGE